MHVGCAWACYRYSANVMKRQIDLKYGRKLTKAERQAKAQSMPLPTLDELFKLIDVNGDGQLSLTEVHPDQ